jgi:hypothetical protein
MIFKKEFTNDRLTDVGDFGPREEWKEEAKGKKSLNPFDSIFFETCLVCRRRCLL